MKNIFKKKRIILNILEIGTFKGNASASFFSISKMQKLFQEIYFQIYVVINPRIDNIYLDNSKETELEDKIIKKPNLIL